MKLLLLITLAALLGCAVAGTALAASPPCPPADDSCAALAGRLEELAEAVAAIPGPSSSPSEVSGTVALAEGDSAKLDLTYGALWFGLGLAGALVVGRLFNAEVRKWSGGSR